MDHPWKNTRLGNLEVLSLDDYIEKYSTNGHKIHSAQRDTTGSVVGQNEFLEVTLPAKTLRDIVQEAEETPDWILQDILKAGELTLLDGRAKLSGKTTLVMHGLKAVREGEPFLGDMTRRARILYLCEQGNNFKEAIEDAELDLDDYGFKVVQWRDTHDIPWPALIASAVRICKEEKREILVCDTFAAFSGIAGTEENNSGDIKQKMEPLKRAANIEGLAVLTTRHSGKNGKGRGSSQFEAEADILVSLKRKDGQGPETVRDLEILGRYGSKRLNIDKTPDGYDNLGSDNRVAFVKALRTIKSVLPTRETDALSESDVLTLAGDKGHKVTRTTGQRALEWLVEHGTVARIGQGVKNNPFRYHLKIDPEFILPNDRSLSGQNESEPETERSESLQFTYITDEADLDVVAGWIDDSPVQRSLGIDIETTGLDPKEATISLVQLSDGETTYVLDARLADLHVLVARLADSPATLIAHSADFERRFIARHYAVDLHFADTRLMSRVLEQGNHPSVHTNSYTLAAVAERYLDETLEKTEQSSDWSTRPLTDEQLSYAAKDARVLVPLYETLQERTRDNGLSEILDIEQRALPAFRWMEDTGVYVDTARLKTYIADLERTAEELHTELKENHADINWSSSQQLIEFFALEKKKGWPRTAKGNLKTGEEDLKRLKHPTVGTLLAWKKAKKQLSTYGEKWLARIAGDGRIHARYDTLGTVTGRTICTSPNMQNLPRETPHKASIIAPENRVLVKADYSQIELRIAAKYVPDEKLIELYQQADVDVHTRMASAITGKPESRITKAERTAAKAANFGPLYGMGAKSLRANAKKNYGVEWSEAQAKAVIQTFRDSYPGIAAWHKQGYRPDDRSELAPTRTLAGRRRRHFKSVTDWFNTPIQGTAADGAKMAMALLHENRSEVPSMSPILFVHDEIVIECDKVEADNAKHLLERCMRSGMDSVANSTEPYIPIEVEATVTDSWAR